MKTMMKTNRWDGLSDRQRRQLITRDPTMRHPRFQALVDRMVAASYAELTPLQRAMVDSLPPVLA